MPNTPSSVLLNSMPYVSGIIIVTTVSLRIMPSWMTFARQGKPSPSVVSVPITRMGFQRGAFETSPKAPAPCSCMPPTDGPRPSPPTFGHKHSNKPRMFEMFYQEKVKHSLPSHCSLTQQLSQTSNTSIRSDAQCTSSKRHCKPVPRFQSGTKDLEWVSSCATHLIMPLQYL